MNFNYFIELFFGGLTRGSIYALLALGYTMVYGIIKLINFAHGEIYMIGAFTALIIVSALNLAGFNIIAAVLLGFFLATRRLFFSGNLIFLIVPMLIIFMTNLCF